MVKITLCLPGINLYAWQNEAMKKGGVNNMFRRIIIHNTMVVNSRKVVADLAYRELYTMDPI